MSTDKNKTEHIVKEIESGMPPELIWKDYLSNWNRNELDAFAKGLFQMSLEHLREDEPVSREAKIKADRLSGCRAFILREIRNGYLDEIASKHGKTLKDILSVDIYGNERVDASTYIQLWDCYHGELEKVIGDLFPIRNDKMLTGQYFERHLSPSSNPQEIIIESDNLYLFKWNLYKLLIDSGNNVTFGFLFNMLKREIGQGSEEMTGIIPEDDIIKQYDEDKQSESDIEESAKANQTKMPVELDTPKARKLFEEAAKAGFITIDGDCYKWKGSKDLCAYFCECASEYLQLKVKDMMDMRSSHPTGIRATSWKPFEQLLGYKNLRLCKSKYKELEKPPIGHHEVDRFFNNIDKPQ